MNRQRPVEVGSASSRHDQAGDPPLATQARCNACGNACAKRQAQTPCGPARVSPAFAVAAMLLLPVPAVALDLKGDEDLITDTVANRDRLRIWDNSQVYGANDVNNINRPEYQPEGLRMGNYLLFPEVGTAVVYDDNIFAIDADQRGDFRSEITPSLRLKSQLPRHVLDMSLDGKLVSYADNGDQDYANYRAKIDGALHFDHAHTLAVSMSSVLAHEERDDPLFTLSAREPIAAFEHSAAIGITRDVGRLYGTLSASADRRDYDDTKAFDGTAIDQDSRDTDTFSTQLKLGYRASPGFEIVGKIKGLKSDNRGDDLLDRDALGFEAVAGLAFEANPLLKWRLLGGYGIRDYRDDALDNLATTLINAEVQWLPTQRLTIYGTLYRQIEEALDLNSAGLLQTGARVKADYEVYHNLVLSGALEMRDDDFRGTNRQDDVFIGRVGLEYYFSKNSLFTFGYEHQVRDSSDDSLDMHRNRFMVGAKFRY